MLHAQRDHLPESMKIFLQAQVFLLLLQGVEHAGALDPERTFEILEICSWLLLPADFTAFLERTSIAVAKKAGMLGLDIGIASAYQFYSRLTPEINKLIVTRKDLQQDACDPFFRHAALTMINGGARNMLDPAPVRRLAIALRWTTDSGRLLMRETFVRFLLGRTLTDLSR